ncbi:hypothetical protein IMZ48_42305, partial [Candidatus Bathyarchaeota archaeon]|nr:hypothetical protein [Candidatus Bathyarchaeota archaeon]
MIKAANSISSQELSSLTAAELAKLPWNKGKPAASEVEPRMYVYPPNGTPSQGLDFLADLKAWGEGDMSGAYLGFDGESPVHPAGPKGSGAEDKRDEVADDRMDVEGDGPPGGTVPGGVQDPDSEIPETPARDSPADDPDLSDTIATPTGLDG